MAVVIGYDGSDFAMQALDWAMDEAELRGLPLLVAHAWQWPYGEATEESKRHLRQAAEHVLWHGADCARKVSSIVEVTTDIHEGIPPSGSSSSRPTRRSWSWVLAGWAGFPRRCSGRSPPG